MPDNRAKRSGAEPFVRGLARPEMLLCSLLLVTGGCGGEPSDGDGLLHDVASSTPTVSQCRDCNVVLIAMDTLRADRLSFYGNSNETSPNIDELARNGLVFSDAITNYTATRNSFLSRRWQRPLAGHA